MPARSLIDTPMLVETNSSVPSTSTASRTAARTSSATAIGARVGVAQHDDELVATEAGQLGVGPDDLAQAHRHRRQQRVADAVAEAVVDRLEVVEVDEQHRDLARLGVGEDGVDAVDQLGAVGQPGEVVVGRRPLQLLSGAALLGDVLDVGDRQRHALVLGDRDAGAGPHELAVAAQVALVHEVGVGDAELEAGPVGGCSTEVLGVGDLADAAPDELVDRAGQHLGQRAVGVEDRRVVEAHEGHPRRRRVERLLEPAAGLLERPHPLLALGDVTHPDEHAAVGLAGAVDRRLDQRGGTPAGVRQPERHRLGGTLGTSSGQPRDEVDPPRRLDERCEGPPGERADGSAGQLGRLGVGAAHHAAVVERHDGLGEVVEKQAQLRLGVDEAFDGAVEVAGDPPRLEPRDDDRRPGQRRHDHGEGHGPR